jgi:hypothetical protein
MQAIPLIALLLGWAEAPPEDARRAVHLGGIAWLLACLAIAWQIGSGRSVLEPTSASAAALLVLLGWVAVFLKSLIRFHRTGVRPSFLAA